MSTPAIPSPFALWHVAHCASYSFAPYAMSAGAYSITDCGLRVAGCAPGREADARSARTAHAIGPVSRDARAMRRTCTRCRRQCPPEGTETEESDPTRRNGADCTCDRPA